MTRIVHCPGCKVLLVEPTAGIAIYQCGNCFKVLYAKHAIQSSLHLQDFVNGNGKGNPPPGPLYTQRDASTCSAEEEEGELPQEGEQKHGNGRLYTPRSQARHAANGPQPSSSSVLLQDMRKLARDAFPPEHEQQQQVTSEFEFEFQRQLSAATSEDTTTTYKLHQPSDYAGSDYHSTLEDLDTHVSDSDSFSASIDYKYSGGGKQAHKQVTTLTRPREQLVPSPSSSSVGTPVQPLRAVGVSQRRNGHHRLGNGFAFCKSSSGGSISNDSEASYRNKQVSSSSGSHKIYPPLELPYVWCQHCKMLLEVPCNLPTLSNKRVQKLRCGACQRISRFAVTYQPLTLDNSAAAAKKHNFSSSWTTSSSSASTPRKHPADHDNGMLQLDVLTSSASPCRASAPASFHHAAAAAAAAAAPQQAFISGHHGKGYNSAPEFQTSFSAAGSHHVQSSSVHHYHHHARSESGTSCSSANGRSLPMAPCLHELFGYESPSHFLDKQQNALPLDDCKHQHQQQQQQVKGNKGRGLKGLLLRSIYDMSKLHVNFNDTAQHVTINGKLISPELVRRAEHQAGSIHPGSYWYDQRAGFWGVMGGPCLGIIPPYIQEFDEPMRIGCAGGKTGVVVNGREVHEQDLEVLMKRGLPSTSNTAYTIDIDGSVIDLASDKRLVVSLGRLAPTIEKRGVGFGMYPLTSAAL